MRKGGGEMPINGNEVPLRTARRDMLQSTTQWGD